MPEALVVCSLLPLPPRSGGPKRSLRLIEAIERAGAVPRLLVHDAPAEGRALAEARGWPVEEHPREVAPVAGRLQQLARREPLPPTPAMSARLAELAPGAAFVLLEEIDNAQQLRGLPAGVRVAASLHNVDSAIRRALAADARAPRDVARNRLRASRMEAVERRAARRADAVLVVSEEDRAHFDRLGARTILAPNGVDPDFFDLDARPADDERVLFFGMFAWRPNVDGVVRYIREAWPLVRRERPSARLRIAGAGDLADVRAVAEQAEGVEVVGFVPDLLAELAATRAVVAPLWVGGGTRIKVLEALAAARPVVGTPLGVERIGIVDGMHALLADDPAGLARHTSDVLADRALAARLGAAGRALVDGLRWEQTTQPAEELYRAWVEAWRSAPRPAVAAG